MPATAGPPGPGCSRLTIGTVAAEAHRPRRWRTASRASTSEAPGLSRLRRRCRAPGGCRLATRLDARPVVARPSKIADRCGPSVQVVVSLLDGAAQAACPQDGKLAALAGEPKSSTRRPSRSIGRSSGWEASVVLPPALHGDFRAGNLTGCTAAARGAGGGEGRTRIRCDHDEDRRPEVEEGFLAESRAAVDWSRRRRSPSGGTTALTGGPRRSPRPGRAADRTEVPRRSTMPVLFSAHDRLGMPRRGMGLEPTSAFFTGLLRVDALPPARHELPQGPARPARLHCWTCGAKMKCRQGQVIADRRGVRPPAY